MSLACRLGCPAERCERRAELPGGGWACRSLVMRGALDPTSAAADAPPRGPGWSRNAVLPCPTCGERAYSRDLGTRRRCRAGHVWDPEAPPADDEPDPVPEPPAARSAEQHVAATCPAYTAGGPDHSRPWAPRTTARPSASMAGAGFIVAGRPSGSGIQHLFRRAGEWSLCGEAVWLEVVRTEHVDHRTWICAGCRETAAREEAA